MRFTQILDLVRINLIQNKFKVLLTSIGIIVGAATIVCVIAIGRGGQADVAEQFRNLNAGALDISCEQPQKGSSSRGANAAGASVRSASNTAKKTDPSASKQSGRSEGKRLPELSCGSFGGNTQTKKNTKKITLSTDDMDDITSSVAGLSEATITYTTKQNIYGGNIEESESYTVAGTLSDYAS